MDATAPPLPDPASLAEASPPPLGGGATRVGPLGASAGPRDPGPPVAVVEAGGRDPLAGSGALLRSRLCAATWVLIFAVGLFFARSFFFVEHASARTAQGLVVAALVGCLLLLRGPVRLAAHQLRALEAAIFGVVTLFLALYQDATMGRLIAHDPRGELPGALRSSIMYSISLMLIYGMLIPNTWARAARAVLPMALMPAAVALWLCRLHPDLPRRSPATFGVEPLTDDALMLIIGAVLSAYGTHVIHSLRAEADEARRMGQYTLGPRIGGGGMGEVYRAEHRLLKRDCALKLIRPDRAGDARAAARFEREVRAMARLTHPNTVEVYDYGRTDGGTFYYVMELLRGLALDDLVARHGPLPAGRVVYLLRQACDALGEAHALGLVHRDLKPANIFAAERGGRHDVVKLLDFGLVREAAEPPSSEGRGDAVVTGSPLFMSPEQAAGERRPDGRSDLYSLGAVAFFLLTGRPPFEGAGAVQVMIAHAREPAPPPSRLRPEVPADLERVVLKLLAKRPAERHPDAEALEGALAACACAADWDARRAAAWWKGLPPGADGPASGHGWSRGDG